MVKESGADPFEKNREPLPVMKNKVQRTLIPGAYVAKVEVGFLVNTGADIECSASKCIFSSIFT